MYWEGNIVSLNFIGGNNQQKKNKVRKTVEEVMPRKVTDRIVEIHKKCSKTSNSDYENNSQNCQGTEKRMS